MGQTGNRGTKTRRGSRGAKKTGKPLERVVNAEEGVVVKVLEFGGDTPARGSSKQLLPDLFESVVQEGEVIRPLYDPLLWAMLLEQNVRLNRCIGAMALNTVGLGFELAPLRETKEFNEENAKNIEDERARLMPLFKYPNPEYSFEEMMQWIKTDEEAEGQSYMEVTRDGKGEIDGMYHAPGHTIRVMAKGEGFLQMRTGIGSESFLFSPGKTSKDSVEKVYFKNFGDKRLMDKNNGEFGEVVPREDQANELIMFKIYSPRSSYYGVPRFVAAAPAISGNRLAQLRNVAFFENDATPRLAVIVSGGTLDSGSVKMIQNFIEAKGKGVANYGRVMVLQPEAKEAVPGAEVGNAKIDLMPLTVGVTEDASFTRYLMLNDEIIREAFGIGKIFLGTADDVNRACYSEDTETLTKGGWKKFEELTGDEEVLAVDPKTGKGEYLRPDKLCVYPYQGKMVEVENRGTSFKVTPDHKVLFRSGTDDRNGWVQGEAQEMAKYSRFRVRVSPEFRDNDVDQAFFLLPGVEVRHGANDASRERNKGPWKIPTEAWSKFIGYFVTEGFLGDVEKTGRYVVGLSQNERIYPDKVRDIREFLDEFPLAFSESSYDDGMVRWTISWKALWIYLEANCGRGAENKHLPPTFRGWGNPSLERLFWAMVDGDGHVYQTKGKVSGYYYSISGKLVDDFQELCVLTGRRGQVCSLQDPRPNRKPGFKVHWAERDKISVYQDSCIEVDYDGKVYCFALPKHHFYVTRRNGKLAVQGNTAFTMKQITMEQVFEPEIKRYEHRLNITIMRDLGAKYTKLRFKRPRMTDVTQEALAYATLAAAGGVTPNDIRELLGFDDFAADWANTPISVLKMGYTEGDVEQPPNVEEEPGAGRPPAGPKTDDPEGDRKRIEKLYGEATGYRGGLNVIADGDPLEVLKTLRNIAIEG